VREKLVERQLPPREVYNDEKAKIVEVRLNY